MYSHNICMRTVAALNNKYISAPVERPFLGTQFA